MISLDKVTFDWGAIAKTAYRLTPPGPSVTKRQAKEAVRSLHRAAENSVEYVYNISGLEVAKDLRDSQVLVVDRPGWVAAASNSFDVLTSPLNNILKDLKDQGQFSEKAQDFLGKLSTFPVASVMGLLSTRVLGQYDPFGNPLASSRKTLTPNEKNVPKTGGALLLNAPSIMEVERELNVDPEDFRLFVCIHEQTHRVQFAAASWLRQHMLDTTEELIRLTLADPNAAVKNVETLLKTSRSKPEDQHNKETAEAQLLSHLVGIMSLLEGHATYVMNNVDASVVPSIKTITHRFANRAKKKGPLQSLLRQVLNMDAKARQYTDGAKFVEAVIDDVGLERFNAIWKRVENLPTEQEIHAPRLWVERIYGD